MVPQLNDFQGPHPGWVKKDDLVKSLQMRFSVIPANPGSGLGQAPESSPFK